MPPDGLGCGVSPTAVGVASGLIDGTGCAVTAATLGCDPVDAAKTNAATKNNGTTARFMVCLSC
jgi:hypothetical protein